MSEYENWTRNDFLAQAVEEIVCAVSEGQTTVDGLADSLESGDIIEVADEYADGHNAGIYYHRAIDLFRNGLTDDYEPEAMEHTVGMVRGGDYMPMLSDIICYAVRLFLIDVYVEAARRVVATNTVAA